MVVTEMTKRVVLQQREALKAKHTANLKEVERLESNIASLKATNVTLKAQYDALKKDIPDPTPAPE